MPLGRYRKLGGTRRVLFPINQLTKKLSMQMLASNKLYLAFAGDLRTAFLTGDRLTAFFFGDACFFGPVAAFLAGLLRATAFRFGEAAFLTPTVFLAFFGEARFLAAPLLAGSFVGDVVVGTSAGAAVTGAAAGEAFFGETAFFAELLRATAFRFFGDDAFLTPACFGARAAFFGDAGFFTAYSDMQNSGWAG